MGEIGNMTQEEIKARIDELESLHKRGVSEVWQDPRTPTKLYQHVINPRIQELKKMLDGN